MTNSSIELSSESGVSDGTSSGGNSPRGFDGGFEQQMQQVTQQLPRISQRALPQIEEYLCDCRRAPVYAYGRCGFCVREKGWA